MKKLLLLFSAALTMLFVGCTQFDDSRIWDAIDELEDLYDDLDGRLEKLEEECQKMNTNIEALQTLVTALQNHDTITSIAPIKQGDEIVGYTITFSQSEPITIYHGTDGKDGADGEDGKDGADGKDGYTPTIGVAQDEDGAYYWTLDGEWLLDENGNKIKAVGTDGKDGEDGEDGANGNDGTNGENGENGKDGIPPQLEIRDGYWYISYDNGATWKELGKATGEDGKDGADGEDGKDGEDGTNGTDGQDGKDGDSLFQSVTWDEEYAYFTLADGTVIKIPLASDSEAEEGDLPPANEIWYTSTDGEVVTPYDAAAFGVNILSNTYENGVGIITFDGDVTSIGYAAFFRCSSLASITIPDSVTSIGNYAFQDCSSLASITIPDSVTSIGESAFFGCTSLTSITIPDSITSIGKGAFCDCSSLASVSIGNGVTSIGDYAFRYCSSLAEFRGKFASSDGRCLIIDGVLHSSAPAGLTEYTIPDSVTSIGDYAFGECYSLASVTIPDYVTSIGVGAFEECYSLASVTIPDSVTSIGIYAFNICLSLAEFRGKFASEDGRCLIIDGVLNSFAPAGLTEYTIPDSVTSIGVRVFFGCSSLASITIPDSVTSIGVNAFYFCSSLASITIPDSVTSIGDYAFAYCESLVSIVIPDSVTSIGEWAFANCSSLASVYCKATTPPTTIPDSSSRWDAFDYNASGRKIYVPEESVEAYKSADGWSKYAYAIKEYAPENYASWLGSYTISGIGSVYDSEADSRVEREVEFTITVEAKDESTLSYNVTGWDGCPYPITAYYGSKDELILSAGMVVEGLDLGDGTYSDMGDLYCVGVFEDNYILTGGPIIKLSKDANQVVGITIDGDEVLGITLCFQAYEDGVFYLLKRYGLLYTPMDMAVSSGASYAPKKAVAFGGRNLGIDRTRTLRVVK